MLLAIVAIVVGLAVLIYGADRFVVGAAAVAQYFGMAPLLIGMLILGLGTSAPEILISLLSAIEGTPELALGNAYGSNISNIALILGVVAIFRPVMVKASILLKELPVLSVITLFALWQIWDFEISQAEALALLILFVGYVAWTLWEGCGQEADAQEDTAKDTASLSIFWAVFWLIVGLVLMVASSRALVWGAIEVAEGFGVSELLIGLTIVAIGTSLPELATTVVAARKGEDDMAIGSVIGSNISNTLLGVGIAGVIHPIEVESAVLYRDFPLMAALTLVLFVICYGFVGNGRINRFEGAGLLACYIGYLSYLGTSVF